MLAESSELARRYKSTTLDATGDALLEATIIHLRLLDEFLGDPRQTQASRSGDRDTAFARHWLPTWKPKQFLTKRQRSRAHAQLAHLSGRRVGSFGWNVSAIVRRCCRLLDRFFDELESEHPKRAKMFSQASSDVRQFFDQKQLPEIRAAVSTSTSMPFVITSGGQAFRSDSTE